MKAREYLHFVILTVVFSQVSCYTLMRPKFYANQALSGGTRSWSNFVPYPFHAYQPSAPIQYYGRYFNDPYFSPNLQNSDYFYAQDPYSPSFADADNDYYANYMTYYVPTGGSGGNRRLSYYETPPATVVEPIDELQDYEDEYAAEDDHVPRAQREWWLNKNVPANEDVDYEQYNQINGILFDGTGGDDDDDNTERITIKKPKLSKYYKSQTAGRKSQLPSSPKSRYVGIDGFGRKKDRGEPIYGNYRKSPRLDDNNAWTQYDGTSGSPATVAVVAQSRQYEYDRDEDVNELRQLAKQNRMADGAAAAATMWGAESNSLAGWASGNAKRNANPAKPIIAGEKWKKLSNNDKWAMYNEGGRMQVQRRMFDDDDDTTRWNNDEISEEMSVFDTIKKLLALEDRTDRKTLRLDKRNKNVKAKSYKTTTTSTTVIPRETVFSSGTSTSTDKSNPRTDGTTVKAFPNFGYESKPETSTIPSSSTSEIFKRSDKKLSTINKNLLYADEVSLVRQLNELRHQSS